MNTISKLLLGVAALGLVACSNDEPQSGENGGSIATGDRAYMNIRITSAENTTPSKSRATEGGIINGGTEKVPYIDGTGKENAVKSAHFYFYDENGNYMLTANRWTGGKPDTEDENIEYIGDNTIVLENLTGKTNPKWMVTVLNQPADKSFVGLSLDQLGKELLTSWSNGDETYPFVMTTSSYFGDDNKDAKNPGTWRYFATALNDNNFYTETPNKENFNEADRVQVFVERLAVRVNVDLVGISNEKGTGKYTENGKEYPIYRVDASVAGNDNDNTGTAASTKLYVAITGWGLDATANKTLLMKDLSGWTNTTSFGTPNWLTPLGGWNHPEYHRSYWGKSYTYGLSGADLSSKLVKANTWENLDLKVADQVFKGDAGYCNENTNEIGNICNGAVADPQKTTTVLLRAVVCNENGEPQEIVNYLGLNFLKADFINKALEISNPQFYTRTQLKDEAGNLQFWPDKTTPKYEYTQVGPNDVVLATARPTADGVKLVVKEKDGETALKYFTISPEKVSKQITYTETGEDGPETTTTYTWTEYEATPAAYASINTALATATNGPSNKATAYTTGAMIYPLPIAHLHQAATSTADAIEGQYGVVRNHIYNMRVTKIKTLGQGVFKPRTLGPDDPAEEIVSNPKNPTYYVESYINILSWKVVANNYEI